MLVENLKQFSDGTNIKNVLLQYRAYFPFIVTISVILWDPWIFSTSRETRLKCSKKPRMQPTYIYFSASSASKVQAILMNVRKSMTIEECMWRLLLCLEHASYVASR